MQNTVSRFNPEKKVALQGLLALGASRYGFSVPMYATTFRMASSFDKVRAMGRINAPRDPWNWLLEFRF